MGAGLLLLALGLVFLLIFSLFWGFIETIMKWFFLEKFLTWNNIGISLLSSILIQLIQIIGLIGTFVLNSYLFMKFEEWDFLKKDLEFFISILIFLLLKFILDSAISCFFLSILKKDIKPSLKASLIPSFISVFLLYGLIMSLVSS